MCHYMHINVQLFTAQILILVSRSGHAYLSPRISLVLDLGKVMHVFIGKAYSEAFSDKGHA